MLKRMPSLRDKIFQEDEDTNEIEKVNKIKGITRASVKKTTRKTKKK